MVFGHRRQAQNGFPLNTVANRNIISIADELYWSEYHCSCVSVSGQRMYAFLYQKARSGIIDCRSNLFDMFHLPVVLLAAPALLIWHT